MVNTRVAPPDGKQWLCGLGKEKPLFVRECYEWFYDEAVRKMSEDCPGLIYTGNPGIGKSTWLNYALVRFLQDGYAVVLERAKASDHFVFQGGICTHKKHQRPDLDDFSEKAVYLFDPDENDSHPLESNVFTIVTSSPQEKHYKALKKLGAGRYYFPCWSLEELQAAKPSSMDSLQVEELFLKWGGIPRYVFGNVQHIYEADLQKAITGLNLSLVFKYMNTPEISEEDQKMISHIVVQYRILEHDDKPFQFVELDFASAWIGKQVVETQAKQDYKKLIGHYEEVRRSPWQGAYCGHLWERLCHEIIPLGTKEGLKLEPLTEGKKQKRRVIKKPLVVEKGKLETMIAALEKGCYFQPSAANFPVIDAMVMEGNDLYGFQMTVASGHPPVAHETLKLLEAIPAGKSLHMVWVVDGVKEGHISTIQSFVQPKDLAKKVNATKMEKLQNIPQWLLKLSFPKESPFIKK
jgi:hypothetical protein